MAVSHIVMDIALADVKQIYYHADRNFKEERFQLVLADESIILIDKALVAEMALAMLTSEEFHRRDMDVLRDEQDRK